MEVEIIEIRVNDDKKIAEIWMTNGDKQNHSVRAELASIYEEYSAKKYTPVVYMSGDKSLYDSTESLLLHNRVRSAEDEIRKSKNKAQER